MSNIFVKIGHGLLWIPKEIGKAFAELPKLITATKDAEAAGSQAVPEVLAVLGDVKNLATASVQDSGVFLTGLTTLGSAIVSAAEKDGIDISTDEAVVAALTAFAKDFNATNVADILTAWKALVASAQTLDATVIADLQKLKTDVS